MGTEWLMLASLKRRFFLFVNDCTGYAAKAVDGCVALVTGDVWAMYNNFIYANPRKGKDSMTSLSDIRAQPSSDLLMLAAYYLSILQASK